MTVKLTKEVNEMKMPGFTAETSLYKTNNHYRLNAIGSSLSAGNTTVTPQGCGIGETIFCGTAIAGGSVLCVSACLAGPAPCVTCWTGVLAIVGYGFCRDCIPGWMRAVIDIFDSGSGGGGGGSSPPPPPSCCPRGQRCCGSCASGTCDDACISPGQSCP
jgi:hypothetical protein